MIPKRFDMGNYDGLVCLCTLIFSAVESAYGRVRVRGTARGRAYVCARFGPPDRLTPPWLALRAPSFTLEHPALLFHYPTTCSSRPVVMSPFLAPLRLLRTPLSRALSAAPGVVRPSGRVSVVEVGPRDGLQNENAVLPTQLKANLVERLVNAGFDTVEVGSLVSKKMVSGWLSSARPPEMRGTAQHPSEPTRVALS